MPDFPSAAPRPDPATLALGWTPEAAYRALLTRDARFDGRLFVGVTSTGVYCRPVCRVRTPKADHCRFFQTPAQAEAAAFRPCLKCRPETAPGWSHTDAAGSLAHSAARALDEALQTAGDTRLAALAARLGVSDRHLRRIFQHTHGVSPRDYLTTQRLLFAKQLLTDTDWPVTQVALASGFDSLRRFNAAFSERYRLQPSRLRKTHRPPAAAVHPGPGHSALRLAWRPPYDLPALLHFLQRRALPGVEVVQHQTLRRSLRWTTADGQVLSGWLQLQFHPERHEVHVDAAPAFAPVLGGLLRRVRQALDLDADPEAIDNVLQRLPVPLRPGTRLPGSFDAFETAARVVLGQQVTVRAAHTLAQRLVDRFGDTVETPFADVHRLFPSAAAVAAASPDALGALGIVRQRVKALQALASAVDHGGLSLAPGAPLQATLDALQALPGIGPWTAQLIALRVLGWPDAWPGSDIGLLNALGSRDQAATSAQAEAWRPWRSYAVMRLWTALEPPP